jgi:hypothetical protein
MKRLSVNRTRLRAGKSCIRIQKLGTKKVNHVNEAVLTGPSMLRPERRGGLWFVYLYTNGRIRTK